MRTTQGITTVDEVDRIRDALVHFEARSETEAVAALRALEELKAACTAAQARAASVLERERLESEFRRGVPASSRGKGLGAEIGLARRESPARGARFLGLARALIRDLPHAMAAVASGVLSEEKAQVLHRETSWLPPEKQNEVDERLSERFDRIGVRRLASEARAHAQRLDQQAAVEHLDRFEKERRVSVRPAPGGMAHLTALLPLRQAVAAYANLQQAAAGLVGSGESGGRSVGQVAADLLVERVTGQQTADAVPVEVHLVMSADTLLTDGEAPAWIRGHGPVPAGAARRMLADPAGAAFLRRLYTAPGTGGLVAMDTRRREFTGLLRRMIELRDDTCRTPWCDAPIRHIDHAIPHRSGGATDWTNASGLCAACNYAKENPGWAHRADPERLVVTTPTGGSYTAETASLCGGTLATGPPDSAAGTRDPAPIRSDTVDEVDGASPDELDSTPWTGDGSGDTAAEAAEGILHPVPDERCRAPEQRCPAPEWKRHASEPGRAVPGHSSDQQGGPAPMQVDSGRAVRLIQPRSQPSPTARPCWGSGQEKVLRAHINADRVDRRQHRPVGVFDLAI
ncbi:HNH endonuclease [Brevibacterium ihuae]|uniref:HNH endonuclease n=1 Tax=Brevibacterium ihuae TaxID=1631743 RepID=UPI000C7611CD|nr:DUF222 domain-containing protein [Brevibacterium ihuae]